MRRLNHLLAALAIAVLMVTLTLLGWMRRQMIEQVEASIAHAAASFPRHEVLHGPGGDRLVRFERIETIAGRLQADAVIRDVVITKLREGEERPVLPFWLAAAEGPGWAASLGGWQREPLGPEGAPWGFLYLDVDRSVVRNTNIALGAVGLALGLMLVTLLLRVWSQETSLTRTMIELNERRRELIRLERLALAGELTAGLLHDLRKPVLNIKHSLDDLAEALGDFAPAAAPLHDLQRQTQLFFQILSDSQIERFVQSDRASEEYVDVAQIVELSLNLVRYEQRGVEVQCDLPAWLPPVLAHPYRLVQLCSNLILNAYQAMGGQGRLKIEAQRRENTIELRFTDNGPGIPAEVREAIFDPFFTTREESGGTGLGLSIARMIAQDLGGRLAVDSRPGGPTTFMLALPVEKTIEA